MKIKKKGLETIKERLSNDRPLTTFEVSRICGVTHSTVSNWVNQGKLTAYKTLGNHKRIKKEHLLLFSQLNQIPIPDEISSLFRPEENNQKEDLFDQKESKNRTIIIIGRDSETLKIIFETIQKWRPAFHLTTAEDSYEAGKSVAKNPPHLAIVDCSASETENLELIRKIRQDKSCVQSKIIGIFQEKQEFPESDFDGVLTKPIDLYKLTSQISRLL